MQTPTPPGVTLAAGYIESHGADDTSAEKELWRAVLRQAGDDLFSPNEQICQDAIIFFMEDDLLEVLDYAGIGTPCAPAVRERALAIWQDWERSRRHRRAVITYCGETPTYREWSQIIGLSAQTIFLRLKKGWSAEKALTTPLQKTGRRGLL